MCWLLFITLYLTSFSFFFFNDTATTEIYTLSLHDALPIWVRYCRRVQGRADGLSCDVSPFLGDAARSEEHTSELQSPCNLVCRLLLEKKNLKNLDKPLFGFNTPSTSAFHTGTSFRRHCA